MPGAPPLRRSSPTWQALRVFNLYTFQRGGPRGVLMILLFPLFSERERKEPKVPDEPRKRSTALLCLIWVMINAC